ncbi:putative vacuolar membrane protein [Cladobotryum mycophilum]|uniref:Vacuolar membrane protein n=1 Tax=Cladobotryum mycophilum TaxID=491253 RepID=A0ABR0SNY2_9HYPO
MAPPPPPPPPGTGTGTGAAAAVAAATTNSTQSADTIQAQNLRRFSEDAAELAASIGSIGSSIRTRSPSPVKGGFLAKMGLGGVARRTLGICCLLVTVFLWTLSNFLASFIFSDHTYDKPFFLVYINTSMFAISMIPMFAKYMLRNGISGLRGDVDRMWTEHKYGVASVKSTVDSDDDDDELGERLLVDEDGAADSADTGSEDGKLSFRETVVVALEFCMLWFLANYLSSACLEYTSVASTTILTSTSSVWTLIFGALARVETFSLRKLTGVMASVAGIVLISTIDLSGQSDENRGSFPHKTSAQVAIGDTMAILSAVIYGVYVTVMKRRVGSEDRFEMPPTGQIWTIILFNSISSFISDISWAYALLLTTPLVVTVGLSMTIPLSLVGEMIQYGQYSSFIYWVGAAVVFVSFVFINNESEEVSGAKERDDVVAELDETASVSGV